MSGTWDDPEPLVDAWWGTASEDCTVTVVLDGEVEKLEFPGGAPVRVGGEARRQIKAEGRWPITWSRNRA